MIDGIEIKLGDKKYTVPPLNFGALRKLQPKFTLVEDIKGIPNEEQIDAILEIVQVAFARNYPDITKQILEESLDLSNCLTIIVAILGVSGLKPSGEQAAGK